MLFYVQRVYNELIYQQKHQSQQQWRNTSLQFDQNNVNKRDEIEKFSQSLVE